MISASLTHAAAFTQKNHCYIMLNPAYSLQEASVSIGIHRAALKVRRCKNFQTTYCSEPKKPSHSWNAASCCLCLYPGRCRRFGRAATSFALATGAERIASSTSWSSGGRSSFLIAFIRKPRRRRLAKLH